jgi:hypothetical protein
MEEINFLKEELENKITRLQNEYKIKIENVKRKISIKEKEKWEKEKKRKADNENDNIWKINGKNYKIPDDIISIIISFHFKNFNLRLVCKKWDLLFIENIEFLEIKLGRSDEDGNPVKSGKSREKHGKALHHNWLKRKNLTIYPLTRKLKIIKIPISKYASVYSTTKKIMLPNRVNTLFLEYHSKNSEFNMLKLTPNKEMINCVTLFLKNAYINRILNDTSPQILIYEPKSKWNEKNILNKSVTTIYYIVCCEPHEAQFFQRFESLTELYFISYERLKDKECLKMLFPNLYEQYYQYLFRNNGNSGIEIPTLKEIPMRENFFKIHVDEKLVKKNTIVKNIDYNTLKITKDDMDKIDFF